MESVVETPEGAVTIRAYMCRRKTLTVKRNRERKCNVGAAIVTIKAEVIHTRHKGIGTNSEVVPARAAAGRGAYNPARHCSLGFTKPSGRRGF